MDTDRDDEIEFKTEKDKYTNLVRPVIMKYSFIIVLSGLLGFYITRKQWHWSEWMSSLIGISVGCIIGMITTGAISIWIVLRKDNTFKKN